MRWASAIASAARLEDAVDEAAEAIGAELTEPADLVFAFVSADYSDHYVRLPAVLASHFPEATRLGCSAGSVIGAQREIEGEAAVALLAATLPDVTITPFHIDDISGDGEIEIDVEDLGISPEEEPDLVLLTDPFTINTQRLLPELDAKLAGSTKIGAISSGTFEAGDGVLLMDEELHRTGAVGIALSGNIEVDTIVAQGCRPIGAPMFVTRSSGNLLYDLDGRSAIATLERLFGTLNDEDRSLARNSLFLGIVMRDQQEVYEHGDFLIRRILGVEPEVQGIAVDARLSPGDIIQFHLRDAHTSTEDLKELLTRHQYASPAGALLFSCMGRGQGLYGEPDHDTKLFHSVMGPVPMAGFFGNGEIGPVQGQTFLHTYTSALALFRPKHRTSDAKQS